MMQQTTLFPLGLDFYFYWAAARAVLEGGNPFDHGIFVEYLRAAGAQFGDDVWYPYLPTSLVFLAPFGALPFEAARLVWFVALAAAVIGLFKVGYGLTGKLQSLTTRERWPLIPAVLLSFPPLLRAAVLGQATILLCLIFFSSLYALREQKEFWAGVLLSVVIIKPQSLLIVLAALGAHSLVLRRWRFISGFLVSLSIEALVIELIRPGIWIEYLEFFRNTGPVLASLPHGLSGYFAANGAPQFPFILAGLEIIVGAVWGFFGTPRLGSIVCAALPISLAFAPYGWLHENLYLFPAVGLISALLIDKYGTVAGIALLLLNIPMLFQIPGSRIESYTLCFPIAVLLLSLLFRRSIQEFTGNGLKSPVFVEG